MPEPKTLTALLLAWGHGDEAALERLVPLVDLDLRQLARRHMAREPTGHTLQTTALINEAYLRLVEGPRVRLRDRAHFFALAARLMRHILVDHARAKAEPQAGRRASARAAERRVRRSPQRGSDLVALDDALDALAAIDPRRGRVVELRFFGGLTVEETARVLGVSVQTVMRDWKLRARLAAARASAGGAPCNLTAGGSSRASITRSRSATPTSARRSSTRCAGTMRRLRRELDSLLAHERSGDTLVEPATARPLPSLVGRMVGAYDVRERARRRRHGRRLPGARHEAESRRRAQDPSRARSRPMPIASRASGARRRCWRR